MTPVPATGRSVVVTGVGRPGQLGEAVARAFGERGDTVCLVARARADADARVDDLRKAGVDARAFVCDLADPSDAERLAHAVRDSVRDVHALVNLAGGFAMSGPVAASDPGVLAAQYAVNVATAYAATRAFLPALRATRGAVVFVASAAALPGARVKGVSAYAMAKTAVLTLMRAVAQEERANGVRANAVAPGSIRTAANLGAMPDGTRYVEREDVAAEIVHLCSDTSRAVTGQVIELAP
jgi:NAD(P)-dependent dehydrogenase (short-subunit alcohol dehydrogenase family)